MIISDIIKILKADIICGHEYLNREVKNVVASDLMSDVLTINSDHLLLLTGLSNIQTIRTAEISDIQCVVLVRNKKASPEIIDLAEENGIVLIECEHSTYKSCGLLFQEGLKSVY